MIAPMIQSMAIVSVRGDESMIRIVLGIFEYGGKKKKGARPINPGFTDIIKKHKIEPKKPLDPELVQLRLASRFTNEAVMCLQVRLDPYHLLGPLPS